ncbi:hypothetical protein EV175_002735, partial [Coemansia sp. RSA 1933]
STQDKDGSAKQSPSAAQLRAAALSSLRAKHNPAKSDERNDGIDKTPESNSPKEKTHQPVSPSTCSTAVQNTPLPPHLSILDAPGRYASDIQGELISVRNKRVLSSVSDPTADKDSRNEEDFETLLEQYTGEQATGDADRGRNKPPHYEGSTDFSATTAIDGGSDAYYERAEPSNQYGVMNGSGYGSANAQQMWMQIPQFRYVNQSKSVFDARAPGQGLFHAPFNVYVNPGGPEQSDGYSAYQQPFHLSRTSLISRKYSRYADRKQAVPPPDKSNGTHAVGNLEAGNDSAQDISDGELVSEVDEDEPMSLSEGEVYDHLEKPNPLISTDIDMIGSTMSAKSDNPDVISIVKERIAMILKNRDPKLLQSPRLRALMLLLKCVKLDDPDTIYAQIKSSSFQVVAELNSLSHEFGLGMITDACMNTLLVARSMDNTPIVAQHESPKSDSQSADMDTRSSSRASESSRGVDMDTSSDIEFGDLPELVDQTPEVGLMQIIPTDIDTLNPLSPQRPPTTPMWFSRSRAPSPPSAQPRTPRTILQMSQSSNPPPPFGIDRTPPTKAQDDVLPSLYDITQSAPDTWESTLCTSEGGRLVVFLEPGDESSESDGVSGFATDYDGDEEVGSMQQVNDGISNVWSSAKARKRETRMLNRECRRLAREEQQGISRTHSFSSLSRLGTSGYPAWSHSNSQPTMRATPPTPNNALHKAKMDLKAHEDAIAKLKLQISRKQAAASLRKTIHVSNAQKSLDTVASAASEPVTPLAETEGDDTSGNSDLQHTPNSEARPPEASVLPTVSDIEELLQRIPAENRPSYSRGIGLILDDTLSLKHAMLRLIQGNQPGDRGRRSDAESLLVRVSPRLDRNYRALEDQKINLSRLVGELQARLKLTDIQLGILDHGRKASDDCQMALEPPDTLQSVSASVPSSAKNKLREDALQEHIRAIQALKASLLPECGSDPAPVSTVGTVRDLRTVPKDYQQQLHSDAPGSNTSGDPKAQVSAAADSDSTRKMRHVAALKSKLETMQNAQKGLSQKLKILASKRETAATPSNGKASPAPGQSMPSAKRQKTAISNIQSCKGNDIRTEVSRLFEVADSCAKRCNAVEHQRRTISEINTSVLDKCILQPLVVADGIGMPALANPTLGLLSKVKIDTTQGQHEAVARESTSNTTVSASALEKIANMTASDYVPYESPFGTIDVGHKNANEAGDNIDLSNLITAHLLGAMQLSPVAHPVSIDRFHRDINEALSKVCKNKAPGFMMKNNVVASALLPIWRSWVRMLNSSSLKKINPLYSAIGFDSLAGAESNILSGVGVNSMPILSNKDKKAFGRALKTNAASLPVLSRDLAFYPAFLDKSSDSKAAPLSATISKRNVRYFEAVQDESGSDSSDGDSDLGDDNLDDNSLMFPSTLNDVEIDSDERVYSKLLRIIWKDRENMNGGGFNANSSTNLSAVNNKRIGRAMIYLKKALQDHPESEKLWDMYLELYSHQLVADSEIVSAFSDATKFNPRSFVIWRRYIRWCGWNVLRSIESSADGVAWQGCLSMATSMAIKCLCGEDQGVRSEKVSATIAELVVYFWECSWAVFESQSKLEAVTKNAPKSAAQFKSRLVAHMHACLTASSTKSLCDEISELSATSTPSTPRSKVAGNSAWKSTEWILGRVLLPHHLLFVGHVFLCCFIEAEFVPRSVLERMYASMHEGLRYQSMYYLCLDNAAERCAYTDVGDDKGPQLQPYIASMVRKMFGGIMDVLLWHGDAGSSSSVQQETLLRRAIQQSCGLCSASMRATLVQLKQTLLTPTIDVESITDCEDLLRIINKSPVKDPLDPKSGLLRVASEKSFAAPLLTTCLLCVDDGQSAMSKFKSSVCAMREHSIRAARSMGIDTSSFTPCTNDRTDIDILSREDIATWISEARQLYYCMVGYTGVPQPKSESLLILSSVSDRDCATTTASARSRFCLRAGTWANIALIEVLYSVFEHGNNLVSRSAIDSALVWLQHGQKQLSADNVGGCAQLWVMALHFTMLYRPLLQNEIAKMHSDIGRISDEQSLHIAPAYQPPTTFVLRTVLDSVQSNKTIGAIRNFESYTNVDNAEIAIR